MMNVTIDKATRWGKHVDLLDGLDVDNWGVMTLDGERRINRHPFGSSLLPPSPSWEMPESVTDAVPDIVRVPDYASVVNYLTPRPLPALIHLDPSEVVDPAVHRLTLYPYAFAYRGRRVQILAAFAPEINTWWIGRIAGQVGPVQVGPVQEDF